MKRLITTTLLLLVLTCASAQKMHMDIFEGLRPKDKPVIVAVHFGVSSIERRATSIDAFNALLKRAYEGVEFREAWTSAFMIRKMAEQGIAVPTVAQLLKELKSEGYTHVLIQPSMISGDTEYGIVKHDVEQAQKDFSHIRIGEPLLQSTEDYQQLAAILTKAYPQQKNSAIVFVGHGSPEKANTHLTMLEYMLHATGNANAYLTSIDGYPDTEATIQVLKKQKIKNVTLVPLLFTRGTHIENDIAVEMAKEFKSAGFKTAAQTRCLAELPDVLNMYLLHAETARQYRTLNDHELRLSKAISSALK